MIFLYQLISLQTVHGRADDQAAAEALANHTRCNNSYVYDLFQALYKSSLTCPHCFRQSNTFDPFLSVSLPIPQRSKKAVFVTVVYLDAHPKQVFSFEQSGALLKVAFV